MSKSSCLLFQWLIFSYLLFFGSLVFGQTSKNFSQPSQQKAHDKKINKREFTPSEQNQFLVKIYTVEDKAAVGRTHHWFLALADTSGKPLNYAKVDLKGYLKADPSVKFRYIDPVFSLCDEGKYVIGYVRVGQTGPWVLEAKIKEKNVEDFFRYEIFIEEKS